ncbi:Uncharacterised protein [Serratia quinivorans]|uniref:hypothetical protein n=1 Tax=Serratia quinivorans TaxID=137545 RepID=UPI00217BFD93|nr:hypothetical protein [Serratia quinivorans]CAI1052649.1 Uncharacterised protein [Serratia quinivorans]
MAETILQAAPLPQRLMVQLRQHFPLVDQRELAALALADLVSDNIAAYFAGRALPTPVAESPTRKAIISVPGLFIAQHCGLFWALHSNSLSVL